MNKIKYSDTDIIKNALENSAPRGKLAQARAQFASIAHANRRQEKEGFTQMSVRSFIARNCTPSPEHFKYVDSSYQALHGFERGSLNYFIVQLHALGFRLFPKAMSAFEFKVASTVSEFEQTFADALSDHAEHYPALSIMTILNAVNSQVRGKGLDVEESAMKARFNVMLTSKPNPTSDEALALSDKLTTAFVEQFETWSQITSAPVEASAIIDHVLRESLGISVNSSIAVAAIIEAKEAVELDYKNSTLVFDPSSEELTGSFSELLCKITARYASEAVTLNKSIKTYVNSCITTTNANGMSWLFGKGFELLGTKDITELATQLGVPKQHESRLEALVEEVKSIDMHSIFTENPFKGARSSVQAFIDSAISNHIARLQTSIDELSAPVEQSATGDMDASHQAIADLQYAKAEYSKQCSSAASILLGSAEANDSTLTDTIEIYKSSRLKIVHADAQINTLNNERHHQELEKIVNVTVTPVSLPFFGQQIIDPKADRVEIMTLRAQLMTEQERIVETLIEQYAPSFSKSLKKEAATQKVYSQKTKKTALKNPEIAARRYFLSRILMTLYRSSDGFRKLAWDRLKELPLFAAHSKTLKEVHEHIYHKQHFVYVHPLDRKPKKLVYLDDDELLNLDFNQLIAEIQECAERGSRDQQNLYTVTTNLLLKSLPGYIDTALIRTSTVTENGDYRLLAALEKSEIKSGDAIHLLNGAYSSKISGLNYRLNKKHFVDTKTFKHLVGPRLYYVPKGTTWNIPPHIARVYSQYLDNDDMQFDDNGALKVVESVEVLASLYKSSPSSKILQLLKQIPHRFAVDAGVKELGVTEYALLIDEGKIKSAKTTKNLVSFSYGRKSEKLKHAIYSVFDGAKMSPPQLQFERAYDVINEEVVEDKSKRVLRFQMPFKSSVESEQQVWSPDFLLGVDPSVYGAGLALIDRKGRVIDSCFVNINSVHQYARTDKEHRQVTTPRQQYKANYSNHLQKAKRSAVGDAARIVDNLVLQLNALPVFEFTKGNQPFEQVWQDVINLYTWGDNDAINAKRYLHWNGASKWWTDLKKAAENEDGHACYPGASISGFGSSQKCPKCDRNAVDAAMRLFEDKSEILINGDGQLVVDDGTLGLEAPDVDTMLVRKQKGFSPAWKTAAAKSVENKSSNKATVLNLVKKSLRRPHENRAAKQGIESLFFCAYTDCKAKGSSDAFAAINHASKYLREKLSDNG
jgi:hypothetical protein